MSSSYFMDSQLAKTDPLEYVTDKVLSCKMYMNYMKIRLQKMFHYDGLPDTIPREMLENYLITNGHCYVTEVNGDLYALIGSFGGEPDAYYRPTRYVVANPGLNLSADYNLQDDGVLIRNDTYWIGLYPLMSRYASLMAENMVTLRVADIMLRVMAMFSAPDDATKTAAEGYLKNLEAGKLSVIGEKRFLDDGVKMQSPPSNNGSYLTQFIELHQYLTGTFYNEVGLNANFNMKRESIGEGESSLNEDSLLPLCEDMLKCRKEDIEKINKMYDTNITVEFDSAWQNNQKEIALNLKKLEVEASASQLAGGDGDNDTTGNGEHADISDTDTVTDGTIGESDETISDEDDGDGNGDTEGDKSNISKDRESEDGGESADDDSESEDVHDVEKDKGDDDDRPTKD